MEWLKAILSNEELSAEQKQEAIQKELPKTFIPKDKYNGKVEELKNTVAKMDELKTQVESMGVSSVEAGKLKTELESITNEFETFKNDSEKRNVNMTKRQAIERGLTRDKANPAAIDLLVGLFNMDEIQLDSKNEVVDWDEIKKPIIEGRKSLFGEIKINGNKPSTGSNTPVNTRRQKYDEAIKSGNTVEAIKIKQEAFEDGEYI